MNKGVPLIDRFWMKVEKRGDDECWPWLGAHDARGYGQLWDGRQRRATQIAWEIRHGSPFPAGMDACHHCDNPACVNPAHIFPGTAADNARDALRNGGWRERPAARLPGSGRDRSG